ncbi:hypothetical protein [Clostridium porci]|uniref:Uncharacterized protein n=1 Tax=Clostridium porci TaxID=2605778 RepID=A0A7X2TEM3_9CLOT|nr:hypothetical protein [Clostridium porci]MSS38725.1 hypothetical protein [Clostridium porci]
MKYYIIEPEVAGEIGENTVYDNYDAIVNEKENPIISHLHFVFDGWLGDELLEVTPCFLVSERLKKEIELKGFSGCKFEDIEISYSDEFLELYPNRNIPVFYRLIPQKSLFIEDEGFFSQDMDDVMMSQKSYLVISENVKKLLNSMKFDENAAYTLLEMR